MITVMLTAKGNFGLTQTLRKTVDVEDAQEILARTCHLFIETMIHLEELGEDSLSQQLVIEFIRQGK